MNPEITVALVGISGYGKSYLHALLNLRPGSNARFCAAVDPFPERCDAIDTVHKAEVRIFRSLDELYAGNNPDLVVLSTPIHLHASQSMYALAKGSCVLCEKPMCAVAQDALSLIDAKNRSSRFLAIGYQWSFSEPVQRLKADILSGVLGAPRHLKSLVLWPRGQTYYNRNNWAGRRTTRDGEWVLDSPVTNAASHFLHNMFYILGERFDLSARPIEVTAELYRANKIENFDTAFLRSRTERGVDISFYVTHAGQEKCTPEMVFEFENATVKTVQGSTALTAFFNDGTTREYGDPEAWGHAKLSCCIDAVRNGEPVACGPEAALSQTLCMNGAQDSHSVSLFPDELVYGRQLNGEHGIAVRDLDEVMRRCYQSGLLPSQCDMPWSTPGKTVDLRNYAWYPGGCRQEHDRTERAAL